MVMAPLSVPRVNSSAGAAVPALACPFPAQALRPVPGGKGALRMMWAALLGHAGTPLVLVK